MKLDVVAVISGHLRLLQSRADSLVAARASPSQQLLFDEFAKALGGFLRGVDEAVLPLFCKRGGQQLASRLSSEHIELKYELGNLFTLQPHSSEYHAGLKSLSVKLHEQRTWAETHLLPWLHEKLDDQERVQLGLEFQERVSDLTGDEPRDFDPSEPASELVEEARLVLRSLPAV